MKIVNTKIDGLNKSICLFGDIHFSVKYNTKRFDKILDSVRMNKPDYICITGDIIDSSEVDSIKDIDKLYNFIRELGEISKVIISLGNHEVMLIKKRRKREYRYPTKFVDNLKKINNVIFLDNDKYVDDNICFIGYTETFSLSFIETGMEDTVINELSELLKDIDNKKYNILLSHNPLYVSKEKVYKNVKGYSKLKLILSGHTHNGLLPTFIKTNTALISPNKRFFVPRARGQFKNGNVDVVITGGVVKLSYVSRIFRYFNFLFPINIDYINIDKR